MRFGVRRGMKLHQFLRAEPYHAGELLPQNLNRFRDVLFPDSVLPVLDRSVFSGEFVKISSDITVEISVWHDAINKPVICVMTSGSNRDEIRRADH